MQVPVPDPPKRPVCRHAQRIPAGVSPNAHTPDPRHSFEDSPELRRSQARLIFGKTAELGRYRRHQATTLNLSHEASRGTV